VKLIINHNNIKNRFKTEYIRGRRANSGFIEIKEIKIGEVFIIYILTYRSAEVTEIKIQKAVRARIEKIIFRS
jgi:hypothetical protein